MFNRLKSMIGSSKTASSPNDGLDKQSMDEILETAMQQIQAGESLAGIQSVMNVVSELEKTAPDTPILAHGYYNAAVCCLGSGQESNAVDLLRKASAIKGDDKDSQKDRLTYMMNLGDVLTRIGDLNEAEKHLKIGLEEREYFYGESHPGVAFGLTPLAANLLAQGRAEEAVPLIDRAVNINIEAGQPEAVSYTHLTLPTIYSV